MYKLSLYFEFVVQGYSGPGSNKGFLKLNFNDIGCLVKCLYLKVSSHGRYAWEFLLALAWTSMNSKLQFHVNNSTSNCYGIEVVARREIKIDMPVKYIK